MASNLHFSLRSNAARAAKRMLADKTAPAPAYQLRTRDDGRTEIIWLTDNPGLAMAAWPAPPTEQAEIAKPVARAPQPAAPPAPGMPAKPTVPDTFAPYRKRFDRLEELALAGDWAGVEACAINGKNTYSNKLRRYRHQLLAARPA